MVVAENLLVLCEMYIFFHICVCIHACVEILSLMRKNREIWSNILWHCNRTIYLERARLPRFNFRYLYTNNSAMGILPLPRDVEGIAQTKLTSYSLQY